MKTTLSITSMIADSQTAPIYEQLRNLARETENCAEMRFDHANRRDSVELRFEATEIPGSKRGKPTDYSVKVYRTKPFKLLRGGGNTETLEADFGGVARLLIPVKRNRLVISDPVEVAKSLVAQMGSM